MQSTVFTQRGLEIDVLGLNLSCVQVKFHTYLGVSDKLLGWMGRRLVTGETEDSYVSSFWDNTEPGQGAYPSNKTSLLDRSSNPDYCMS